MRVEVCQPALNGCQVGSEINLFSAGSGEETDPLVRQDRSAEIVRRCLARGGEFRLRRCDVVKEERDVLIRGDFDSARRSFAAPLLFRLFV